MSFQDKVMSMFANVKSRIEALAARMETRDQEIRQEWCHLIRVQLVSLDCGPQKGVINKIYNLLHHVLG